MKPNNLELILCECSSISERLRLARLVKMISQQGLADAMNALGMGKIGRTSVAQWESGATKEIEAKNLLKAARVLGVHPEVLAFGGFLNEEKV